MKNKLSPKEKQFCVEYVACNEGNEAAIRAKYSKKTARSKASQLLTKVNIQEEIKKLRDAQEERTLVKSDDIILELAKLGFSDVREIFNPDGSLIDIKKLPASIAACISSVEIEELFDGSGPLRRQIGYTKKVKFWNKNNALELLGKYKHLWDDNSILKDLVTALSVTVNKNYGNNG